MWYCWRRRRRQALEQGPAPPRSPRPGLRVRVTAAILPLAACLSIKMWYQCHLQASTGIVAASSAEVTLFFSPASAAGKRSFLLHPPAPLRHTHWYHEDDQEAYSYTSEHDVRSKLTTLNSIIAHLNSSSGSGGHEAAAEHAMAALDGLYSRLRGSQRCRSAHAGQSQRHSNCGRCSAPATAAGGSHAARCIAKH